MHFKEQVDPLPFAYDALLRMKADYSLHVVTARQHRYEDLTRMWLNKHFPDIFDDIHFGNHYCSTGKSRSKAEICKSIGAQLLIDDSMIYATQCALEGIAVVLFGHYPWNQVIESSSAFHDMTIVLNAHQRSEVIISDFHPGLIHEPAPSSASRHVYRVKSWDMAELAVKHMLLSVSAPAEVQQQQAVHRLTSTLGQRLAVMAVQMCSMNDKAHNLARTKELVAKAVAAGDQVDLVCLPEGSEFLSSHPQDTAQAAEQMDGEYVQALCALAKQHGVWISVGGFHVPSSTPSGVDGVNKVFNVHFLIDREGCVQHPVYHKIHLFDCPLVGLQESLWTVPGSQAVVMEVEGWKIGLAVCYDLRFPALFDAMHGIDLLLLPAAFTVPTGSAHWEVLLRARAIEQQCYVVAAAQAGQHNAKRASYGHSMVVDPWGRIVSQLYEEDEGVCGALLEKETMHEIRKSMPVKVSRVINT